MSHIEGFSMTITQTIATHLSEYIDTEFFNGRQPHIRGRRIPVAVIAYNSEKGGDSVADLMRNFDLSQDEVIAALVYYVEHRTEIDTVEKALHEEFKHYYDSSD